MKVALGQGEAEEYQEGLTQVAETLKGTVGLLFTRLPREEVRLLASSPFVSLPSLQSSCLSKGYRAVLDSFISPFGFSPGDIVSLAAKDLPLSKGHGAVQIAVTVGL